MLRIARAALVALVMGVVSVVAKAQTLSVPEGLVQGSNVVISYSDPSKANQTITVEIDDGAFPQATVTTVVIHLDANGNGSMKWRVPEWVCAKFNAPGVFEQVRAIFEQG